MAAGEVTIVVTFLHKDIKDLKQFQLQRNVYCMGLFLSPQIDNASILFIRYG